MKNVRADTAPVAAEVLTVQEVADICRVSTDSVYRATQRGELEAEDVCSRLRVRPAGSRNTGAERRQALKRRAIGLPAVESASQAGLGRD
jgi:hypothetical protein